ncbi:hypothetical protein [Asticcacaulis benevestitus]|uniref:Uncharacterized protein n=1 Tax=Asticcacaulis benevestitus DSM 16100 = ATCC BAA-896 TaxID=1121022 RepID=V4PT21_9CAUL|nr:hypothetical protein [Asticcacaulis benevestitus]ESQ90514.1 hypothetical protein ABENE_12390 [Asticcacaulis benevestitus DSM 16100 = ATCC BAA-896]
MTTRYAYWLLHTNDRNDEKGLGFYVSKESANKAVEYYREVSGFSDNPDGFEIFPVAVSGPPNFDVVHVLWDMTEDERDERSSSWREYFLGAYSRREDAEAYKLRVEKERSDREIVIDSCVLDHKEWLEGF